MDREFFEGLADNVNNGPTPFINMANMQAEVVEERHVKLRLPVEGLHMNHVGIAYAGSEFILAEIAGGTLFMATYGTDEFVPILKGVDIKFVKPGTKDLQVDIALTEEEAEEKIGARSASAVAATTSWTSPVYDVDGLLVAQMNFNYYALPAQH